MFPESGQTRKHCFLAMFPEAGQTRKQCFLIMFPEGGQTRKHILVMFRKDGQNRVDLVNCFNFSMMFTYCILHTFLYIHPFLLCIAVASFLIQFYNKTKKKLPFIDM